MPNEKKPASSPTQKPSVTKPSTTIVTPKPSSIVPKPTERSSNKWDIVDTGGGNIKKGSD